MKKNIFVSLLIGMMGVIALCGCEKKYTAKETNIENMTECFIGQWKCTDSKYCRDDDKILLNFDIDSLYVEVNTKYRCAFPKGRYKYEFLADTLCIFMDNYCMSYVSSINSNISNINDSFIEKQLIETNSTLLNKNEVKNVFKII